MVNVFYPAIVHTEGPYTQLFEPSEEALNTFKEMEADRNHISELIVDFTNNAKIIDNQPLPIILFSPGIGEEMRSVMKDVIAKAYSEGQEYLFLNSTDHESSQKSEEQAICGFQISR